MGKMIKAILIDDDYSARNILQKFLEDEEKVHVISSLENTLQAIELIEKHHPDVVFLDINMPYENGLNFASRMKTSGIGTMLVFTTAFHNYAFEAFNLKPFEFLVKPFGVNDISNLVCKIESKLNCKKIDSDSNLIFEKLGKLKFKTVQGYMFLLPNEIVYIRSIRNYCEIYLISGNYEKICSPISEIYNDICQKNFYMINRSVIINLSYIVRFDRKLKKCLLCENKVEFEFPVSQKNLNFFETMNTVKLG